MKFLYLIIYLNFSLLCFSQQNFYLSNNSGMILDEIEQDQIGQFCIVKQSNRNNWKIEYTYYNNGNVVKYLEETYSKNFNILNERVTIENNNKTVEVFNNNLLSNITSYLEEIVVQRINYTYNSKNYISKIEYYNENNILEYKDEYYTNNDGSLRKIIRKKRNDYSLNWFYKNGKIVESWLTEENKTTRTIYLDNGKIDTETIYNNNIEISMEKNTYRANGTISFKRKVNSKETIESNYNNSNLIIDEKLYKNEILTKITKFIYDKNLYLIESISTGHGIKEKVLYIRNEDGVLKETQIYINDLIDYKIIFFDENRETYEFYRDGIIILKEYYINNEKIKRELYLDGKLYKSEKLNE